MQKSKFIDPLLSYEVVGKKRVRTFHLDNESDTAEYEIIMNQGDKFSIIRESTSTDRNGRMLVTVWFAEIEEH